MASNTPTDEELDTFTREQIVAFLRSRNKRRSGRKAELLAYAKAVAKESPEENVIVETTVLSELIDKRKVFENESLAWNPFQVLKSSDIPADFDLSMIEKFLTDLAIQLGKKTIFLPCRNRNYWKNLRSLFTKYYV